ncbi:MAG: alpha/beta hydrolase [bacterium]|nr:alpha/beta hydrolase [Candidatus Kapabacteria bacterium]
MTIQELFAAPVHIQRDITYVDRDPDDRHRLDVYSPPEASSLPVVIFFYGGGWRSGDKRLFEHLGRAFATRGIVAVTVNYRLTPAVTSPAHVQDCAAACAWVQSNIATHGGDSRRIVLCGHSAGAHLATLLAVDDRFLNAVGFDTTSICGVVAISGVYDLTEHVGSTVFTSAEHVREAFGNSESELLIASPVKYIKAGLPPFLVMVAEDDPAGLRAQGKDFSDAIRDVGTNAMFVSIKGRDHFSIVRRFGPSTDTTATAIAEFVHHICPAT